MDRAQIMDDLDDIQRKVDAMGFRGGNEYDLTVREEVADYIQKNFIKKAEFHYTPNKWSTNPLGGYYLPYTPPKQGAIFPQQPKGGIFPAN